MIHSKYPLLKLLTPIFVFFIGVTGCKLIVEDQNETETNHEYQAYAIDTISILDRISNGETDLFTRHDAPPGMPGSELPLLVDWHQAKYLLIAKTLHQQAWQEDMGPDNLFKVTFEIGCPNIDISAFRNATFSTYKLVMVGEEEIRIEKDIVITPSENLIETYMSEYSPNVKTKSPIDVAAYKFSAEEALQIADQQGGKEVREKYADDCRVYILSQAAESPSWYISYSNNKDGFWQRIFTSVVDVQNGSIQVIYSE